MMKPYNDKEDKKIQVERMFDNIAPSYDMLNHMLSFNIDKCWRRRLIRMLVADNPVDILDVAAGTGDLSVMAARKLPGSFVTGVDISEGMLEVARKKAAQAKLDSRMKFVNCDAEHLPSDEQFDAVTVAFGIRNFKNLDVALGEMHRVLREGGKVFLLEFNKPRHKIFYKIYRWYSKAVIPTVGGLLSNDVDAYRYLMNSIEEFSKVNVMAKMHNVGFKKCKTVILTDGIAVIYIGEK